MHFVSRFSQFFISPLVKGEAMDREVLAVDSGTYHLIFAQSIESSLTLQIIWYYVFWKWSIHLLCVMLVTCISPWTLFCTRWVRIVFIVVVLFAMWHHNSVQFVIQNSTKSCKMILAVFNSFSAIHLYWGILLIGSFGVSLGVLPCIMCQFLFPWLVLTCICMHKGTKKAWVMPSTKESICEKGFWRCIEITIMVDLWN